MDQDMGAAMQFLQSKGLCLMPLELASVMKAARGGEGEGEEGEEGGGGGEEETGGGEGSTERTSAQGVQELGTRQPKEEGVEES